MDDKKRAPALDYMTGAELQTMREALHLTRDDLAELAGVAARTVKHWESGRSSVPADVAEAVTRLETLTASAVLEELRLWRAQLGADMVLIRYRSAADMPASLRASLDGMAAWVQAAIVARVRSTALVWGGVVRVVWFDAQDYAAWLAREDRRNTPASIMHWAREALASQARPHRADQPPAAV